MSNPNTFLAWLEQSDGTRVQLLVDCPIGRLPENKIVFADEKVSRHHALIQHREYNEYWLVDVGSSNGTFLNHRRIRAPALLHNGDIIHIGDHALSFHQVIGLENDARSVNTLFEVKSIYAWLLVADVEGSSRLQESCPLDEARQVIHDWMCKARQVVESRGGVVNQFLGDGVFAYWLDEGESSTDISHVLGDFQILRRQGELRFRLTLHYGYVMTGGSVLGEENLYGPDVNFVFRMEQLAKQLKEFCLISETAARNLRGVVEAPPLGCYALPAFRGETLFHHYPA